MQRKKQPQEIEEEYVSLKDKRVKVITKYTTNKHIYGKIHKNPLFLEISLPEQLSKKDKNNFRERILQKLFTKYFKNIKTISKETSFNIYKIKSFKFYDKTYYLQSKRESRYITLKENVFTIPYNENYSEKEHIKIKKVIGKILAEVYAKKIRKEVLQINQETFNEKFSKVTTKYLKSKWGSCSSKRELILNIKLLNASTEIRRYVIIHELAHLKEMNHSRKFWQLVEQYVDNLPEIKKALQIREIDIF